MGDLFDSYRPVAAWDEMFEAPGMARPHYAAIHDVLGTLTDEDHAERCVARDRSFRDQGITFSLSGEERPFPLDLVPRVIAADEWEVIEAGRGAAGQGARGLPGRPLRPGPGPRRRGRAPAPRAVLDPLPPGGDRDRAGQRGARPRGRHRPRARRRGPLPGAGGQPPHAVGHLLRDREPPGHDPRLPRALRQPPGAARRRLPRPPARGAPGGGPSGARATRPSSS